MKGVFGKQRPIGFKPAEISALINREVVEQHSEEAAFLWTQRDSAALAPNYSLADLAKLDGRVEAHLDGLRASGEFGWSLAFDARDTEPGEAFAAAVLAFESHNPARVEPVVETAVSDRILQRGVVSALGWIQTDQAVQSVARLAGVESAECRRIALATFAIHRRDPRDFLVRCVDSDHERLRARALKAVGELGRTDLAGNLAAHFTESGAQTRLLAAWSSARLRVNQPQAIRILMAGAEEGGPDSERAAGMVARVLPPADVALWQQTLFSRSHTRRLAVLVSGVIGDPADIPWLIEQMEQPDLARIAGEAFSLVTGADLGYEDLDADAPDFEKDHHAEADNADEEDEATDPDEDLQWPAPRQIEAWWSKRHHLFPVGLRHLRGEPITPQSLVRTLASGTQRQRASAALELAISNPAEPLFEVRERGDRQLHRIRR